MELFMAGGVGEHGRSCFFVKGEAIRFLVDCGTMADTPADPYPRLTPEDILGLDAVFLTHSHADHTGALPWLYENGFAGTVIATEETLRQLLFPVGNSRTLDELCPKGTGQFQDLSVRWGRSGHCVGSVWYRFTENGKSILFSGDYTEETQIYACDPIRDQQANLAVLDCAYGKDETSYSTACNRLVNETQRLLAVHKLLLFPIPKYGRGLEILKLFSDRLDSVSYYADDCFLENLAVQRAGGFWFLQKEIRATVQPYCGETQGIVCVSDPHLRSEAARNTAGQVLSLGGRVAMTGTLEKGSYSEELYRQGNMELLRYPVHLNQTQFQQLVKRSRFEKTVAYHSADFTSPQKIPLGVS